MKKPKITIESNIPFIGDRLAGEFECEYYPWDEITSDKLTGSRALLVRTRNIVDRPLIEGTPVEFVGTATIGLDHIDLDAMKQLGVEAVNAPGCNAPGVAQYVWSSLLRMGFDPKRHKLGLVGKGNIGKIVAGWGRLLGAEVMVCDPPRAEAGMTDEEYLPLGRLAEECDALTFHVPRTYGGKHKTMGLCSAEIISLMKPGTFLVNAARGGIVDEEALIEAIEGKGISAAIDTWTDEPRADRRLVELARYATPHIAGYSRQGKERATRMVLASLGRHFGVDIDLGGLEPDYVMPAEISAQRIVDSYDPGVDTELLRGDTEHIETVRCAYRLREEA